MSGTGDGEGVGGGPVSTGGVGVGVGSGVEVGFGVRSGAGVVFGVGFGVGGAVGRGVRFGTAVGLGVGRVVGLGVAWPGVCVTTPIGRSWSIRGRPHSIVATSPGVQDLVPDPRVPALAHGDHGAVGQAEAVGGVDDRAVGQGDRRR